VRWKTANANDLRNLTLKYSEAKAVDSVYAIFIFGIGVFTPEQFSLKKLKSLALSNRPLQFINSIVAKSSDF